MTIEGKTVLVTGANRGIGQALAAEALVRGAKQVYAGTRQPLAHPDERVTPLMLDVTSTAQVQAAASQAGCWRTGPATGCCPRPWPARRPAWSWAGAATSTGSTRARRRRTSSPRHGRKIKILIPNGCRSGTCSATRLISQKGRADRRQHADAAGAAAR